MIVVSRTLQLRTTLRIVAFEFDTRQKKRGRATAFSTYAFDSFIFHRLFYESTSSNADAKMQKTRMLTRRKACAIEPKVTTVMLSFDTTIQRSTEKVTVKKTKPRKKRSRKEDLSQLESGSEADSAESECISSTSGTKRQRRVSKFLSRMYVL